jgi:hypothetical protein
VVKILRLPTLALWCKVNGMDTNWAAENLQTIRTLMERSAIYRRALAPIMIFCGGVGIAGGVLGALLLHMDSMRGFVLFWLGVAAMALTGSFVLVRKQALKDSEPFWSPPTRCVAQALLPPFFIGLAASAAVAVWGTNTEGYDLRLDRQAVILGWTWLYGCAIYSAGFFMPRGIKLFGWLFILAGCALLSIFVFWPQALVKIGPHFLTGTIFGVLHLAYGAYLYLTEKGKNAA